jgi:hypothetical protein
MLQKALEAENELLQGASCELQAGWRLSRQCHLTKCVLHYLHVAFVRAQPRLMRETRAELFQHPRYS